MDFFLFLIDPNNAYVLNEPHYCRGGLDAPLILPNGDVSMCPAWKNLTQFVVGNIYQKSMEDIWNSNNFRLFREFIENDYKNINEPCKTCKYLRKCRGKCVAQRLLAQDLNGQQIDLADAMRNSPDPMCFKDLLGD